MPTPEQQIDGEGPTFEAALARACEASAHAAELLAIAAHLGPGRIPLDIVSASRMSPHHSTAASKALASSGLATTTAASSGERYIEVSDAVKEAMRARAERRGEASVNAALAVSALAETYPHGIDDPGDARHWGRCSQLEPHVNSVLAFAPDDGNGALETGQLLRQHAHYLFARGRYDEVEPLLRRAGAIGEEMWGADHPHAAQDRTDLAVVLSEMGRAEEALSHMRRAMAIDEAAYGPEHPLVAERYNILATLLERLGRPAEADPFIRHAVLAAEKMLGPDHPDTKLYRDNYAAIIASVDAMARRDEAVEEGLLPAPPERLARPDIPPPPARDRPRLLSRLRGRR